MIKRTMKATCAALVTVMLMVGVQSPAMAAPASPLPEDARRELVRVWTQHDVPAQSQTELLAALERGELIDAMAGGAPSTIDVKRTTAGIENIQRFPDGSMNVLTAATPDSAQDGDGEGLGLDAVQGCTQSGYRYNNCLVSGWFSLVQLSFRATYVLGTTAGRILELHSPAVQCYPSITCTAPSLNLIRQRQSGRTAAQAGVSTHYSFVGVGGTGTTYLYLYVRDLSAWTN